LERNNGRLGRSFQAKKMIEGGYPIDNKVDRRNDIDNELEDTGGGTYH
jgi:hypothetical protein